MNEPPTEHKVEKDHAWQIDRATGEVTPFEGVRVLWRFEGERYWRRKVIVPDAKQGQTVASLMADAPVIVAALARAELAERAAA